MASAVGYSPAWPVAAIIGPPGPQGPPGGNPVRFDVPTPAATWILPHGFARVPMVQIFLPNGELIGSDVTAGASLITVTFGQPTAGFALVS